MLTNEQVQNTFRKAIAMCDESGFHSPILIQRVEYNRCKKSYGYCKTHRDMFGAISTIYVSKYYVEKCNEQQLLETLVHECLHSWAFCVGENGHKGKWLQASIWTARRMFWVCGSVKMRAPNSGQRYSIA